MRDANAGRIKSLNLVLGGRLISKMRLMNKKPCLVRTSHLAVGATYAEIIIDHHDAVGALPRRRGRTDVHARRICAVLTAYRNKHAAHVRIRARLNIEYLAPLHCGRCCIGVPTCGGARLAADAPLKIGDHDPARHTQPSRDIKNTIRR